jgi:hypothetical protein
MKTIPYYSSIVTLSLTALSLVSLAFPAKAVTIDDYSASFSQTNNGWEGSGQLLTVPAADSTLDFITVYANSNSAGQQFDVRVTDSFNSGTLLFENLDVPIVAGANTFAIGQAFAPGSQIHVSFDYNGYSGLSLQYQGNVYSGGNSTFMNGSSDYNSQSNFAGLDHQFLAQWSGGAAVPDHGSTALLMGLAILGLGTAKRRSRSRK